MKNINLTFILLLFGTLISMGQVNVTYEIDGTNLGITGADCGDCQGDVDPEWRNRVRINGSTWYNWNAGGEYGCGYSGLTNNNWHPSTNGVNNHQIEIEMDAWESDAGSFLGVCGDDDGDCGGYSNVATETIGNYDPCVWSYFTDGRNNCSSDGETFDYQLQWGLYWVFNEAPTIVTQPVAVNELCLGTSTTLTVATNDDGFGHTLGRFFQWQVSENTDCSGAAGWMDIPGATTASYTAPEISGTRLYRVLTTSNCTADYNSKTTISDCARVTYNPMDGTSTADISFPYPTGDTAPAIQSGICGQTVLPGSSHNLGALLPPAVDAIAGVTYSWSVTGGSLSSSMGASVIWTAPTAAGSYSLTLEYLDVCGSANATAPTCIVNVGSPECGFKYVADFGGDNASNGGPNNPYRSIAYAIQEAQAAGVEHIRVANGNYIESSIINLYDNLIIDGGYDVTGGIWKKASSASTNITCQGEESVDANTGHLIGFRADGISGWTLLDLNITTDAVTTRTSSGNGYSNYALFVRNSTGYEIIRTSINSGAAASGNGAIAGAQGNAIDPFDGNNGSNGGRGGNGVDGDGSSGCDGPQAGGASGSAGLGGFGPAGSGANGGAGGFGGAGARDCDNATNNCSNVSQTFARLNGAASSVGGNGGGAGACGGNGSNGANGGNGSNGAGVGNGTNGANGNYSFVAGLFVPGAGANGTTGSAGRGGGGGGGGSWYDCCSTCTCFDDTGAGGAGGGGGGGAGGAALGGLGGGASFGYYVADAASSGILTDVSASAGASGTGGLGGDGGTGGSGGGAGTRGAAADDGGAGGFAGSGSKGADGGDGGDGSNGISFASFINGTGSTLSNPIPSIDANVCVNNAKICRNSRIPVTSSSAGTWDVPGFGTAFDYVNDLTATTTAFTSTSHPAEVYTTTEDQVGTLIINGTNYPGYLIVNDDLRNAPSITAISDICEGETVDLSAASNWGTEVEFEWEIFGPFTDAASANSAGTLAYSSSSATETTTPWDVTDGDPDYYLVRYSVREECCGWSIYAYEPFIVYPEITDNMITALMPDDVVCSNGTDVITGNVPMGGDGTFAYQWEYSTDGIAWTMASGASATAQSITVQDEGLAVGTYFFRRQVDSAGCNSISNVVTIIVKEAPVAPTAVVATPSSACVSALIDFTLTGGSLGTDSYWVLYDMDPSLGFPPVRSGTDPAVDFADVPVNTLGVTTFYVVAEGGCEETAPVTVDVTINTESETALLLTADPDNGCEPLATELTIIGGSLGTGAEWYLYDTDPTVGTPTAIDNTTGSTFNITGLTSTTTFYVRAEGDCNTTTAVSVEVTVDSAPAAPFVLNATPTVLCNGGPVNFEVLGVLSGTGAEWVLYNGIPGAGGAVVGTTTGSTFAAPVGVFTTTTFYVRGEGTCGSSAAISVTVTVDSPSTAATGLMASPMSVCTGGSSSLTITGGSLGSGAEWYLYDTDPSVGGATAIDNNTSGMFTVSPSTTTTYYVQAESTGSCPNTTAVSTMVTVNSGTATTITGYDVACMGGTVELDAGEESAGTPFTSYAWDDAGSSTTQTINVGAGTYTVTVTDSNGCTSTATKTITEEMCSAQILDPCRCLNNATTDSDGQYGETVQVDAPAGQTWTVTSVTTLYEVNAADVDEQAMVGTVYGTTNDVNGVTLEESAPGQYQVAGVHTDGVGYSITLTNADGSINLMINNNCTYIDANDLAFDFGDCDNTIGVNYTGGVAGNPDYTYTMISSDGIGGDADGTFNNTGDFTSNEATTATFIVSGASDGCISQQVVVDFTVDCPDGLPVELLDFSGYPNDKVNVLEWKTATEENTKYHIVERSVDGISDFYEIGRLDAAGNSVVEVSYNLEDDKPLGVGYYRLKTVDIDGTEHLSNVIVIKRGRKAFGFVSVFPNPTRDLTNIQFNAIQDSEINIQLVDVAGRLMNSYSFQAVEGMNTHQLDMSALANGVYIVKMNNGNAEISYRLVKQN